MELITLSRGDADFESYLMGTFASDHRALPIETVFAPSHAERVTFRVVPVARLDIPHWWMIYLAATRPELIALTLGPVLVTWLNHHARPAAWETWPAWAALCGVFFLHVAAFIANDVQDHRRGADRLGRGGGSRIIQNGWTTAAAMAFWARVNLGLAATCGVIACLNAPLEIGAVCLTAAACLGVLQLNVGTRRGACDVALIALFGPLLTVGTALASFGAADVTDLALGLAFGVSTWWVLQLRQFENLFRANPRSFRTYLGYLNFDGARWCVVVEGFALLALIPTVAVVVRAPLLFIALLPAFGLPLIWRINRVYRATSPLSSDLVNSAGGALVAHFTFTAWWILALGASWL